VSLSNISTFVDPALYPGPFVRLPLWVLRVPNRFLSAADKFLFARLLAYWGRNRKCYPFQHTLARLLGKTTRSVKRGIARLVKAGLIEILPRHHTNAANQYRFLAHEWMGNSVPPRLNLPNRDPKKPVVVDPYQTKWTFVAVPCWVLEYDHQALQWGTKSVLVALLGRWGRGTASRRLCYPTQESLALDTGLSRKEVARNLAVLERGGLLYVARSENTFQGNSYLFPQHAVWGRTPEWEVFQQQEGVGGEGGQLSFAWDTCVPWLGTSPSHLNRTDQEGDHILPSVGCSLSSWSDQPEEIRSERASHAQHPTEGASLEGAGGGDVVAVVVPDTTYSQNTRPMIQAQAQAVAVLVAAATATFSEPESWSVFVPGAYQEGTMPDHDRLKAVMAADAAGAEKSKTSLLAKNAKQAAKASKNASKASESSPEGETPWKPGKASGKAPVEILKLEASWHKRLSDLLPGYEPVPWAGPEWGQARSLLVRYPLSKLERLLDYVFGNWGHINQTRFKGLRTAPELGMVLYLHSALDQERFVWEDYAKVKAEVDAWYANNPNAFAPASLHAKLDAAKAKVPWLQNQKGAK